MNFCFEIKMSYMISYLKNKHSKRVVYQQLWQQCLLITNLVGNM